jgi:hypothetical protein
MHTELRPDIYRSNRVTPTKSDISESLDTLGALA